MGIAEDIAGEHGWHAALAALAWQHDLGVTEVVGDAPVNRYDLPESARAVVTAPALAPAAQTVSDRAETVRPATVAGDAVAAAVAAAAGAATLADLRVAMERYDFCELKRGAKTLVFADGNPAARVLILGEAPGREEDVAGLPFVGRAGQLLDAMLAAIGLSRASPDAATAVYLTNAMPWRPLQNRDPEPAEIAMMRPFVERHIALIDPDLVIAMGNAPCESLLGQSGITRLRGTWAQAFGKPVLPMFHPSHLLRNPAAKREAWADLLAVQARLRSGAR